MKSDNDQTNSFLLESSFFLLNKEKDFDTPSQQL
jgi:hypothetical protein